MGLFVAVTELCSVLLLSQSLLKLFSDDDVLFTADIERSTLMEFGWFYVQDTLSAVCSPSAGLFADKCKRVGFIHEPEFSVEVFRCWWINENSAG